MLNIIGEALDELYRVFNILNHDYYENKLPEPVITIQKARPNNLGHFTLGKSNGIKNNGIKITE